MEGKPEKKKRAPKGSQSSTKPPDPDFRALNMNTTPPTDTSPPNTRSKSKKKPPVLVP